MKNSSGKSLIIIGFMGSGKTTVGRTLAGRLKLDFFDMDSEIENTCMCSIPYIFKKYGEYYFRGLESRMAEQAAALKNTVIATGGGIVKNPANMETLAKAGVIVYLKTTAQQVYDNTRNDQGRPLLNAPDRQQAIEGLLKQREPLYERYGSITVEAAGKSVEEITDEVIMKILGVDFL